MLFRRQLLELIACGKVDLAFRRWRRPTVRAGGTLRTPLCILAIEAVDVVDRGGISHDDARQAGFASRADLLAELDSRPRPQAPVYRIAFRLAADPRRDLRPDEEPSEAEMALISKRLARLDQRRTTGAWTASVLHAIAAEPGTRAGDLARRLSRDKPAFKADVRKLSALGLTVSLPVGYRLTRRGAAYLSRRQPAPSPGQDAPANSRS